MTLGIPSLITACGSAPVESRKDQRPPVPVVVVPVVQKTLPVQIRSTGVVEASATVAVYSTVGAGGASSVTNNGRLFMRLKERSHRSRGVDQIIQELRPKLSQFAGIRVFLQNPPTIRLGAQISKALYQYTISDTNLEGLYASAPELEKKLRQLDNLQDVTSDLQIKNPQVSIDIDRDRASALGITASQIENALAYAYATSKVSTIYGTDNQYSVIMGLSPEYQADLKSLDLLSVRSPLVKEVAPPTTQFMKPVWCASVRS